METRNYNSPDLPWSSIMTEQLLARDDAMPECGSGQEGDWDVGSRVFALVLVFAVSTIGCGSPLFSKRFPILQGGTTQPKILFYCQHFGTGVLLATAFVHLLPTAYTNLTNPCLGWPATKRFKPLAGAIALLSVLLVTSLDSWLNGKGAGHSHGQNIWEDNAGKGQQGSSPRGYAQVTNDVELGEMESSGLIRNASPLPGSAPSGGMTLPENGSAAKDGGDEDDFIIRQNELDPAERLPGEEEQTRPVDPEEVKRQINQVILLEFGILAHSVFIGMSISATLGPSFWTFLFAICFHQLFEGLALGTRIARIPFPSRWKPYVMILAFGFTTPFGQLIGIVTHRIYDPASRAGLAWAGATNAISSGLLLFAGLGQLVAEDFLSQHGQHTLAGRKKQAFGALWGGAIMMTAVGAFA
ncbi:hypothetical protein OQA88_7651 [Cercophora sp. LCS_1]